MIKKENLSSYIFTEFSFFRSIWSVFLEVQITWIHRKFWIYWDIIKDSEIFFYDYVLLAIFLRWSCPRECLPRALTFHFVDISRDFLKSFQNHNHKDC